MRRVLLVSVVALFGCHGAPTAVSDSPPASVAAPTFNLEGMVFHPETGQEAGVPVANNLAEFALTTNCTFTTNGSTMRLDGDCTTDGTIVVPDGMTLDGRGHTITAVDPLGDHFRGAVIQNGGLWAAVRDVTVTVSNLANVCDGGDDRLRGIMFDGASGEITKNSVVGINQGPSGCQEGNAIEVRNAPFDGTHPNTRSVRITRNVIDEYQKTGIVANGDVDVVVEHNRLGASATQQNLAANGVQLGSGAFGLVRHNEVAGNQWLGTSNFAASAILIFDADGAVVSHNRVTGNSDVGLFVSADGGTYEHNDIRDFGVDGPNGDFGMVDLGSGNVFNHSLVCGFDTPFFPDPLPGMQNKALPDPACSG